MKHDRISLFQKYIWIPFSLLMGILFLVILSCSGLFGGSDGPQVLGIPLYEQAQVQQVLASCRELSESDTAAFAATLSFDGKKAPSAGTLLLLPQNMNSDDWQGFLSLSESSVPVGSTADGAASDGSASKQLSSEVSSFWPSVLFFGPDSLFEAKKQALSEGHIFRLYGLDEAAKTYAALDVTFTGLPLLEVSTGSSQEMNYPDSLAETDPDTYYFDDETRYFGSMTAWDPSHSASGDISSLSCGVTYHERGATSAIFEKKNYALKFSDSHPLFGMPPSDKWKLIGMFTDRSKVRDMTCLQLWEEIASTRSTFDEHSARMEYCELILDGEYQGLYGLLYPVNEQTLGLGDQDILYKVLDGKPPSEGGLHYSIENGYRVALPLRMRYIGRQAPVAHPWEPMQEYLQAAYYHPDPTALASMLELENVADFLIFTQATSASDNQFKNTYLVSRYQNAIKSSYSGYTTYILPWDLNLTFGDVYEYNPDTLYMGYGDDTSVIYAETTLEAIFEQAVGATNSARLRVGLPGVENARDLLQQSYREYRNGILSPSHMQELFQANMDALQQSGAFARDSSRWPDSQNDSDLSRLFAYTEERMQFLDSYFGDYYDNLAKQEP